MDLLNLWICWLRAAFQMSLVSSRRLLFSRQSLICLALVLLAAVATWAAAHRRGPMSLADFTRMIVLGVYLRFLLPLLCLCFASASISSDREEQTLVYVFSSPVPRPLIFLSRFVATLLLVLAWTTGALLLLGLLARTDRGVLLFQFVPIMALTTLAYVALFQLFSVAFRRATILSLIYVLLLEMIVGALPGTAKRLTISFYAQCMVFEAGKAFQLRPWGRRGQEAFELLFQPISAGAAEGVLLLLTLLICTLAAVSFTRSEY